METQLLPYTDSAENRSRLFDFYNQVYPDSPWLLDEDRFVWQSFLNPLKGEDQSVIWLLYDENGQLIGQNIYILYTLSVDNKDYAGYCSTNLIVKPGIVGKGFGHKMIQRNEDFDGIAYAVGITPASTRAFEKRGWRYITSAKMMSRIYRTGPNLKYINMPSWKRCLVAPAIKSLNALANFYSALKVPGHLEGIRTRPIDRFLPEWDQLWDQYLAEYAIKFKRESNMLNYKYCSRKDVAHNVILVELDSKPVGYGVYRLSVNKIKNLRLGRIVDIVYDPSIGSSLLKYMIGYMKKEFIKMDVDGLVAVAATDEIASAFKANGLYLSRLQPAIIKEEDFSIDELESRYKYLWYISLGDSDLDNYW